MCVCVCVCVCVSKHPQTHTDLVQWGDIRYFVWHVCFSVYTTERTTTICAHSCVRTAAREVYFYTRICFDVTLCTQRHTHTHTHKHAQRHLHGHIQDEECECEALCQFNLCSGTFMWDQNKWQLQRGCSASLGCVGVIVSGSRLITRHTLRSPPCLGHYGKLSGRPAVDLMQSHREPSSLHLSDSHRLHTWMETKPPGVKPFVN